MNLAVACRLLSAFLLASVAIGDEYGPKRRKLKQVPSEDIHVPHDEQGLIINRRLQKKRGGGDTSALHAEEGQGKKQEAAAEAETAADAEGEDEEDRKERLAAHNEWVERTRERQQLKKASRRATQERVLTEHEHKEEMPSRSSGEVMQQDQEQLRTARRQRRQSRIRSAFAAGIAAERAEDEEAAWNFAKKSKSKKRKQGGKRGEAPDQEASKPKDVLHDVVARSPSQGPGKNMSREKGYAFDLMKRQNRGNKSAQAKVEENEEEKEEEAAEDEGEKQHEVLEQRRKERIERHNHEVEQLELAKHDRFMQDQRAHQLRMHKRYDRKRQEEKNYEKAQAERQRHRIEEKLGKAAESQRAAAQAIIKPAPKDPFKTVMLEMGAMEQALGAISEAVKDKRFMAAVDAASEGLRLAAIKYMHAGEKQVDTFIRSSENATQRELVAHFASLFTDSSKLLAQHKMEAGGALMKMRAAMPAALLKNLAPLMAGLGPTAEAVRLDVDEASLANMSYIYACGQVREMMEKVIPLNSNLTKVHAVLNTTARYVPMLHSLMPALAPEVHVLAKKIVNLGYTEALALEDVAHALMLKAGPVIEDKFHCTWSASSAGPAAAPLSLLAIAASALALAVGWRSIC